MQRKKVRTKKKERITEPKLDVGRIQVIIQSEDRLQAITNLSRAVVSLSQALENNVRVAISNCTVSALGKIPGISIDTGNDVVETKIIQKKN